MPNSVLWGQNLPCQRAEAAGAPLSRREPAGGAGALQGCPRQPQVLAGSALALSPWALDVPQLLPCPALCCRKPDTVKQKNAFPPNFIHSLDSTHMMLTALHCFRWAPGWSRAGRRQRGRAGQLPGAASLGGLQALRGECPLLTCQPQGFCGAGNSAELGLPALPPSTFCCLPGRG